MKWEYTIEVAPKEKTLFDELSSFGELGWENYWIWEDDEFYTLFFKRQID